MTTTGQQETAPVVVWFRYRRSVVPRSRALVHARRWKEADSVWRSRCDEGFNPSEVEEVEEPTPHRAGAGEPCAKCAMALLLIERASVRKKQG
jgi:pentatricopeptide repeat protein